MMDVTYKPTPKKDTKAAFPIERLKTIEKPPDMSWFMKANKTSSMFKDASVNADPIGDNFCHIHG